MAQERFARALCSLEGLSVGDAFGERFFRHYGTLQQLLARSDLPAMRGLDLGSSPWHWTDDSAMALSIVDTLREHHTINQNYLAKHFAGQYIIEPRRGYGPAMHRLLPKLLEDDVWQTAPRDLFERQGSFGNGAAMRVAPIGAYFADNISVVSQEAERSAVVTHVHPEGVAGAIAIAVATALAYQMRDLPKPRAQDFLDQVLALTPRSLVASGTRRARDLRPDTSIQSAVGVLGNGSQVTAQDTAPFVIWSAARNLDNYEEALWSTVAGLGDMDTTCAMVGGIVVMYTGVESIPAEWRRNREPLPNLDDA
ncbi:MAG: ADP-ribosylglycohydrolase family protein [Chloroflexota bacterium]